MLEVRDLSVGYGTAVVVHDVSFGVSRSEVLSIIGPNGSGKSTLLRGLFGLARVFSGEVRFNGESITSKPPFERVSMGMSYLPQVGNVFESLTVRENILLASCSLPKGAEEERLKEVLEFLPELKGLMGRKVRTLSGGERQMVALAMSLLHRPKLLMLDEPTAALAPKLASAFLKKLVELRDQLGVSIILVEQNAIAALEISDKALLMVSGEVRYYGEPDTLLSDKELGRRFLGLRW